MASQRRLERRRNLAKLMRTKLKSSKDIYDFLNTNQQSKDIIIGYIDSNKEECEILFTLFKPDDDLCDILFENITYYRTTKNILWNKKSRIDTLFNSGATKLKLQKNPNITDVSFANYNNMPPFVKKVIYVDKMQSQLTDLLLGLRLKMTSVLLKNNITLQSNINNESKLNVLSENKDSINTPKHSTRYSHFLSIRLNNPNIIKLGKQLQQDIMNEYKKQNISINSSLIQPIKFHISMNIMALPTDKDVEKFVKIFKLVQKWLKVFVFDKSDSKKVLIGDDGIFQEFMEKHGYQKKLKEIYEGIEKENIKGINGYPLYLEGANHFNQRVVFLDFKNKCVTEMNNIKWKAKRTNRNELVLKLIETFYELIVCLCKAYKIGADDSMFIPHCTVMKLSKLRGIEMKKLLKYNKMNEIRLLKSENNLSENKKKKRRDNKVYDWHVLAMSLSNQNIDKKIKLIGEDNNKMELYEDVMKIDFCAMMGSHLTDDGYYNIIQSLSIVP